MPGKELNSVPKMKNRCYTVQDFTCLVLNKSIYIKLSEVCSCIDIKIILIKARRVRII